MPAKKQLIILLADDDKDDQLYFARALKRIEIPTTLEIVDDGEALMNYFSHDRDVFPDILFLDVNMPRKNGMECMTQIMANTKIKKFPIIIYSTSFNGAVADIFYKNGAQYYLRKNDFSELVAYLKFILDKLNSNTLKQVDREDFVLSSRPI